MTAADWVIIITAIFGGIVLCINAYGTYFGRKEAKANAVEQGAKLDVIHDLTNSSMTALKAELANALARIDKLEGMLSNRLRREGDMK